MSEDNTINEPGKRKKKSGGSKILNILLVIAVIVVGVLFVRAEMQRRATEQDLKKTAEELQQAKAATQNNGQEAANAILAKVRTLMDVPADPAPTVATITDVDSLRKTNDFYKKASNGDNIIVTQDRAILYDPVKNIIIDVVPVQITSPSPSPTGTPEATVKPVK